MAVSRRLRLRAVSLDAFQLLEKCHDQRGVDLLEVQA